MDGRGLPISMFISDIIRLLEILLVNFVLSGDNALVIAVATLRLNRSQRRLAVLYGTVMSIILRVWLTIAFGKVLSFPYLQAIGGFLLAYLAISVLMPEEAGRNTEKMAKAPRKLWSAVVSITLADLTMSLDNVIALAGIASGDERILVIGLVISISLIMFASALLAGVLARYRFVQYAGSAVLAWTAGGMLGQDPAVSEWLSAIPFGPFLAVLVVGAVLYGAVRLVRTTF